MCYIERVVNLLKKVFCSAWILSERDTSKRHFVVLDGIRFCRYPKLKEPVIRFAVLALALLLVASGYGAHNGFHLVELKEIEASNAPLSAPLSRFETNTSKGKEDPSLGFDARIPDMNLELVWIDPGQFEMGSNDGNDNEKPVHRVNITHGYWLGKTEITQAQWRSVMGSDPGHFKGDNLPVENVSWEDCEKFCKKLTDREQKAGRLPNGYVYRLPTEAEWEYAARGGIKSKGFEYAGGDNIDSFGWYYENSMDKTHPVGRKKPNELGLYDMSGSVYEWCYDKYGSYTSDDKTNPSGSLQSWCYVYRGGSWYLGASYCRTTFRDCLRPLSFHAYLGLRVALAPIIRDRSGIILEGRR
jgi:formylglycine-generating enzyme required for sulfatase activity